MSNDNEANGIAGGRIAAIVSLPIAERVLKRALKNLEHCAEGLEGDARVDVAVALSEVRDVMHAMGIKSRERGELPTKSMEV